MSDAPGTLEERLRRNSGWRNERHQCVTDPNLLTEAADEIASLRARVEVMREALEAISVSGIHRDPKWFGMNAHDIARQALKDTVE